MDDVLQVIPCSLYTSRWKGQSGSHMRECVLVTYCQQTLVDLSAFHPPLSVSIDSVWSSFTAGQINQRQPTQTTHTHCHTGHTHTGHTHIQITHTQATRTQTTISVTQRVQTLYSILQRISNTNHHCFNNLLDRCHTCDFVARLWHASKSHRIEQRTITKTSRDCATRLDATCDTPSHLRLWHATPCRRCDIGLTHEPVLFCSLSCCKEKMCFFNPTNVSQQSRLIDCVKVWHPAWHKIDYFGDALPSQSLG